MSYSELYQEEAIARARFHASEAELEATKLRHPLWRDQDNTTALRARKAAYRAMREALDQYQEASDRLAQLRISAGVRGVAL